MKELPDVHPVLFTLLCLLMLVWSGLCPGLAMSRPRPRFEPGSPAALAVRIGAVLAANFMVVLSGGWMQWTLGTDGPTELGLAGRALFFLLLYVLFLLFYAPPRLMLIRLDGDRLALISFMVALAVLVWPLTA